jgi:hypothetical protein
MLQAFAAAAAAAAAISEEVEPVKMLCSCGGVLWN